MAPVALLFAALELATPFGQVRVEEPTFPPREVQATDYPSFTAAIDACAAAGGGRVTVPAGEWTTGAIHLRSNVELHFEDGAKLVFTDDPADYLPVVRTSWEGVECYNYSPLVYAYGCTNVAITGKGTLAPVTTLWTKWWDAESMAPGYERERLYTWCAKGVPVEERDLTKTLGQGARPQLIQFNRCHRVLLDGFSITSSPLWCIHLLLSSSISVRGVEITAREHNSDGIDFEMSHDVCVEGCSFQQGDDGLVVKAGRNQDGWRLDAPSYNIVVTNCVLRQSNNILAIGSELSAGVSNVFVTGITGPGTQSGLYIKTNRRRGGFVRNVWMENVDVEHFDACVLALETDVLYQWANFPDYEIRYTPIENVHLRNIRVGKCSYDARLVGDRHLPPRNLTMDDVAIDHYYSRKEPYYIVTNIMGFAVNGVTLAHDWYAGGETTLGADETLDLGGVDFDAGASVTVSGAGTVVLERDQPDAFELRGGKLVIVGDPSRFDFSRIELNDCPVETYSPSGEPYSTDWWFFADGVKGFSYGGEWNAAGDAFLFANALPSGQDAVVTVDLDAGWVEELPSVEEASPVSFAFLKDETTGLLVPYGFASGLWHRLEGPVPADLERIALTISFRRIRRRWTVGYAVNGAAYSSDGTTALPLVADPRTFTRLTLTGPGDLHGLRGVLSDSFRPGFLIFLK